MDEDDFPFLSVIIEPNAAWNPVFALRNDTRSCGRFGPARLGSTALRSSSAVSSYDASGADGSRNSPCAFAYSSTRRTCDGVRPVSFR